MSDDFRDEVRAAFVDMRDNVFTSARVSVYHGMLEYSGMRSAPVVQTGAVGMGQDQQIAAGVRLNVADFGPTHPKEGDAIEIAEYDVPERKTRVVLNVTYDRVGACAILTYGERYG